MIKAIDHWKGLGEMSDLEKDDLFAEKVDDEEIEFIDYDIDEDTEVYQDDVETLSKEAKKKLEKQEFDLKKEIMSWIIMLISAVGIAWFISTFILINAVVPTGSMERTIPTGSRMIGFRLSYIFSEPERGDIVVFKNPFDEKEDYVKRVIGLPGETVLVEGAKVYIYDAEGNLKLGPLNEPYINGQWTNRADGYKFQVPEDCYLMFGDNRNSSYDARGWSETVANSNGAYSEDIIYIHKDKILGQAIFTYWDKFKVFDDVKY